MRSGSSGCSGRSATTSPCSAPRRRPTPSGAPIRFGVHDYVEVDDGIVLERLANLTDLDDFVAAVAAWVVPPRS